MATSDIRDCVSCLEEEVYDQESVLSAADEVMDLPLGWSSSEG